MALIKFNVMHWLTGQLQFTAEIDVSDDTSHELRLGLSLTWAVKSRANLDGANLARANLDGANLDGATVRMLVARAGRSDGHEFLAYDTDRGLIVRAGCRTFSLSQFRDHVASEYPGTDKATETSDILDFIEKRAGAMRPAQAEAA